MPFVQVAVSKIKIHPFISKHTVSRPLLDSMIDSAKDVGILNPLVVRRDGENFELIDGRLRLAAAKELKISVVPCMVHDLTDEQALDYWEYASVLYEKV